MKAIFTADWHLSNSLPYAKRSPNNLVSDRLEDLRKALDWVFSAANDRQLPLFILGDIFDRRQPDAVTLKTAAILFHSAAVAGMKIFILPGNHDAYDTRGLHYAIEAFGLTGMDGIRIMEAGVTERIDGVDFCPVPFQSLNETKKQIREYREAKFSLPRILLLHDTVIGSRFPGGYVAEDGIPKEELEGFTYVLAGHIHGFQKLPVDGVYVGSPSQLNFNEVYHEPSIGMLSVEAGKAVYHRIKMPTELSSHFAEATMDSDGKCVEQNPSSAKYVRLIFGGDDESLEVRRPEIDELMAGFSQNARSTMFLHRGSSKALRQRFSIDVVAHGIPPMETLIMDYAKMHRDDATDFITAGLSILEEVND